MTKIYPKGTWIILETDIFCMVICLISKIRSWCKECNFQSSNLFWNKNMKDNHIHNQNQRTYYLIQVMKNCWLQINVISTSRERKVMLVKAVVIQVETAKLNLHEHNIYKTDSWGTSKAAENTARMGMLAKRRAFDLD